MSNESNIRSVLGSQCDDKSILAQALTKVIQQATTPEERAQLLAIALVERDSVTKNPKDLPNTGISDDDWGTLSRTHDDMIDGHMKMAFFNSKTATEFAREILRLMDFFETDNEKTYTLACVLFSPYVPYKQLPGTPIRMTNAEFRHKLDSDQDRRDLIRYIVELPFSERSEMASMILQVVDDTTDRGLRVALLAAALFKFERRVTKPFRKVLES